MIDRPSCIFPLYLGVYIFHYASSKLMARPIPIYNWPGKSIIFFCQVYICCYVLFPFFLSRICSFFYKLSSSSNFAYRRLYWHENISITTHLIRIYCHRTNNSTASFTNISIVLNLIWLDFLGVRFDVRGRGVKLPPV